jgi:Phage integrase family
MLRHGCGYKLANDGVDTRTIQSYLGHNSIQHTVRYTELAPTLLIASSAIENALNHTSSPNRRYSGLCERLLSQPTFLSAGQAKSGPEKE